MRFPVAFLSLLAVGGSSVALSGPAFGWTKYTASPVVAGPVLAGDRAVWAEDPEGGPLTIHVGSGGGSDRVVYTAPWGSNQRLSVVGLAATAGRVAVGVRTLEDPGPRYSQDVLAGTPEGGFVPVEHSGDDAVCWNLGFALQGDVLAETRSNCDGQEVALRDLRGGGDPRPIAWTSGRPYREGVQAAGIRLAGRFAAWYLPPTFESPISKVVVYDLEAGREAYRLDLTALLGDAISTNYALGFELQNDGTVAVAVPSADSGQNPATLLWASVNDPRSHEIPAQPRAISLALHGGLIAFPRALSGDWAVTDLSGAPRDIFHFDEPQYQSFPRLSGFGVAFDGTRVAWVDRHFPSVEMNAVHLELYPVRASPYLPRQAATVDEGAAQIGLACPRSGPRCKGTLLLIRRRQVIGRARFAIAHQRSATVRVPLSRSARRGLRRRGRLKVLAIVKIAGRKSEVPIIVRQPA